MKTRYRCDGVLCEEAPGYDSKFERLAAVLMGSREPTKPEKYVLLSVLHDNYHHFTDGNRQIVQDILSRDEIDRIETLIEIAIRADERGTQRRIQAWLDEAMTI